MFDIKTVEYPIRYANYQQNSCVGVPIKATGKLLWKKAFSEVDEMLTVSPQSLLINDDCLGVQSTMHLLLFNKNGNSLDVLPIGENTPVVFGNGAFAYFKRTFLLNYQSYQNKPILELKSIPSFDEWSYLLFFKPDSKNIMAASQFTGGPERLPESYEIYSVSVEKRWPTWSQEGEGVIDHVLLSPDNKSLVVMQKTDVTVFNGSDGKTSASFDTDFIEIETVSLDPAGNLVILGQKKVVNRPRYVLEVIDRVGKSQWLYPLTHPQSDQPPVCDGNGNVFVVDGGQLKCVVNGEIAWADALSMKEKTWLTATADGHLVCLNGKRLCVYDPAGKKILELSVTEEEEDFSAPPSIGRDGVLYIAGSEHLYCFE